MPQSDRGTARPGVDHHRCGGLAEGIAGPSAVEHDSPGTPKFQEVGAEAVEIQGASLRSTQGGCEIEVSFRNVTRHTLLVGFTYDLLDGGGHVVTSRGTSVQYVGAGETGHVSSAGTTAGPSGVPCSRISTTRLQSVSAWVIGS